MIPRGDYETVTYLGYPIRLEEHRPTIYAPDGRRILGPIRWSIPSARAFIRGYRKGD